MVVQRSESTDVRPVELLRRLGKRHGGWWIVGGLLALALSFAVGTTPLSQTTVGLVGGAGLILSVFGLAVSVVGFAVTLQQIKQTRSDVAATQAEATRIRSALKQYDVLQESTKAEYALRATKLHMDAEFPSGITSSYTDFNHSLLLIREHADDLPDDLGAAMDSACKYVDSLCRRIDGNKVTLDEKHISVLRTHFLLARRLQAHLSKSVI